MPNVHQPNFSTPQTVLAPMEGLTDPAMRDILTHVGGFDWCVSEFIRITNSELPDKVWHSYVPELLTAGTTASGTPVHIQLLGNHAEYMALNAHNAASLGAPAIDLNFGCPAKTVNKHKGGAILLTEPDTVYRLVKAVRDAVPSYIAVSAKMRLGYEDDSLCLDNALAIQQAGASWLTIHARTKTDGYRPPAYWHKIAPLQPHITIPIIANGEIWHAEHASLCQQRAATSHLMLGRGAVSTPDLAIRLQGKPALSWQQVVALQSRFLQAPRKDDIALLGRYKQWLGMLTQGYAQAVPLWQLIKKTTSLALAVQLLQQLEQQLEQQPPEEGIDPL